MNYKVTFYKNTLELLTERKANFVNQLKKLSTIITNKLSNEVKTDGKTVSEKIVNFMIQMGQNHNENERLLFTLDGFTSQNKPIVICVDFICKSNSRFPTFDVHGACYHNSENNKFTVTHVQVVVNFTLDIYNLEQSKKIMVSNFIKEFHPVLVHELAHSKDEHLKDEQKSKRVGSRHEMFKFLMYFIGATEIRSHFNQMLPYVKDKKMFSPKREIKSKWKELEKTDIESKNELRKKFSSLSNDYNSSNNEFEDALKKVISMSFGAADKNLQKFIFDYHIAFARDFNDTMNTRYYKPYFSNLNPPSLKQMNNFLTGIRDVYRQLVKLEILINSGGYDYCDYLYSTMAENFFTQVSDFDEVFETYEKKRLLEISDNVIDNFKFENEIDY